MTAAPTVNDRTGYIGGSDAAVILNASPWKSRMQLCAEKKGVAAIDLDSATETRFYFGNLLEASIGEAVTHYHGLRVQRSTHENSFVRSVKHPFMGGHVDFDILDAQGRVTSFLECKNIRFNSNDWGDMCDDPLVEDASDRVPPYYLLQCHHYLAVKELPYCYLAALFGGCELRLYRLSRNLDAERILIQAENDFWARYVVGDELPEPKGAEDYQLILSIIGSMPEMQKRVVQLTAEQAEAARELAVCRAKIEKLEKRVKVLRDEFVVVAGGARATFIDENGETLGNLAAGIRKGPDLDAFKKACPDEYKKYGSFTKTTPYFIVRMLREKEE